MDFYYFCRSCRQPDDLKIEARVGQAPETVPCPDCGEGMRQSLRNTRIQFKTKPGWTRYTQFDTLPPEIIGADRSDPARKAFVDNTRGREPQTLGRTRIGVYKA